MRLVRPPPVFPMWVVWVAAVLSLGVVLLSGMYWIAALAMAWEWWRTI